jgi:hypothetical protein
VKHMTAAGLMSVLRNYSHTVSMCLVVPAGSQQPSAGFDYCCSSHHTVRMPPNSF